MKSMRAPVALVLLATLSLAGCGSSNADGGTAAADVRPLAPQPSVAPVAAVLTDAQVRSFLDETQRASHAGDRVAAAALLADDVKMTMFVPGNPTRVLGKSEMLDTMSGVTDASRSGDSQIRSIQISSDGSSATAISTSSFTGVTKNGQHVSATDEQEAEIQMRGGKPQLVALTVRGTSATVDGVKQY